MALSDAQQISLGGLYEGGAELTLVFFTNTRVQLCNGWIPSTLLEELNRLHNPSLNHPTHDELYNIGVQILKFCSVYNASQQKQCLEFTKERMTDFNHWFFLLKFEHDLRKTMWNYGISYEEAIASLAKIHLIEPVMES